MPGDQPHLSDEDLLLAADGELSSSHLGWSYAGWSHTRRIRAHLADCAHCRAQLAAMEKAAADFALAHRETLDARISSAAGTRALLRIRLAEMSRGSRAGFWQRLARSTPQLGWAAAAVVFSIGIGIFAYSPSASRKDADQAAAFDPAFDSGFVPNRDLTPGETRPVSMDEVCSLPHEEVIKDVSASVRERVFQEYGIAGARADDYEVDYLIAPGLGGVEDIHNLWPEPYRAGTWDAHAKDALEERLHELVCAHKLDLVTAQRAIATNWISAYKKYFDTDRPDFVAELPRPLRFGIRAPAHG
jgi:hypothetical protein